MMTVDSIVRGTLVKRFRQAFNKREKDSMQQGYMAVFDRFPELQELQDEFQRVADVLLAVIRSGGTIFACGNGGSASDAEHIVGELMKGFLLSRPVPTEFREQLVGAYGCERGNSLADRLQRGIRAVSLVGHPALSTAYANDMAADMIFAQQVYGLGKPGDALIGLSSSGNSPNVVQAFEVAGMLGIHRIGFTGETGGRLLSLCDFCLRVPAREAYRVQEYHLPLYHALCACLEETLYGPE
jgi:D-sedoheptulose 7-phosphate isomerase